MADTRSEKEKLRGEGFGKPFSPKWWGNFWFYYGKFVVIGACVIAVIAFTIYEAANKVTPDSYINYIGYHNFSDQQLGDMTGYLEDISHDVNNDGQRAVIINRYAFDPAKAETDQTTANQMQTINLNLAVGDQVIYLMDRASFDVFAAQTNDYFVDITDLAAQYHISQDRIISANGHTVGINLTGSGFLKKCGVDIEAIDNGEDNGIYLAIRKQRNTEKEDTEKKASYQNNWQMAEKIVKSIPAE